MSGDAIGVAVQLLNAHRTHVDGVLECLRGEMEKLAEFEAHGDGSAHRVAEYASCIAESMHKRFPKCGECHNVAHDLNNWPAK